MSQCACCGAPLPPSHRHRTCSMCYGDLDYGTDGYYRDFMEQQQQAEAEPGARAAVPTKETDR